MRFLLVDQILELTPGRHIRAVKHIALDEDYFRDHFPGFPVVPGVLLTEMMAQAAGKCLAAEGGTRGRPMLAQIKSATFRQWVGPGKTVILVADIKLNRPQLATADCRAEVDGQPVCSAEIFFSFVPADRFSPELRDEVLDNYLKSL
ncbi:MAG: 3-hydroxyacyl-ACP dehydratase FabZ family protein [Verrucomicrobiota bacterium]